MKWQTLPSLSESCFTLRRMGKSVPVLIDLCQFSWVYVWWVTFVCLSTRISKVYLSTRGERGLSFFSLFVTKIWSPKAHWTISDKYYCVTMRWSWIESLDRRISTNFILHWHKILHRRSTNSNKILYLRSTWYVFCVRS